MLTFAQFERELASERTKDKMLERAKKGFCNGGYAPFGYKRKDKRLFVNRKEAEIIKLIYEKYIETGSIGKVYSFLKERNIKNRQDKFFNKPAIAYFLRNPVYAGKIKFNNQIYQGIHQPIISEEVFELVQKIHKKRVRKFRVYRNFLFGGLVNCEECGYKMTPCFTNKWSEGKLKRYFYYRCTSTTHKGWKACSIKQVSADRLEKYVLENLERISLDRNYVENLVFKLNYGLGSSNPELKNLDLPHRPRYELSKVCSKSFQFSVENIISILKSFLSLLSQRKGIERNLLAKKFIKGIFYSKENIKITLFYSENPKNLKFSQIRESPACRQAGGANLSDEKEIKSLKLPQNEFVAYDSGCGGRNRTYIPSSRDSLPTVSRPSKIILSSISL